MADTMLSERDAWVADAFGVDPAGYDMSPSAAASPSQAGQPVPPAGPPPGGTQVNVVIPPANETPAPKAAAAATTTIFLPFSKPIPLPVWKPKVAGDRIELKVSLSVQVTGKISVTDKATSIDQDALGKAALQMATSWFDSLARPEVEGKLFDKLEVKREGLSIVASAETKTSIGTFAFKADLAKIDHALNSDASLKIEIKVADASVTYIGNPTSMKNMDIWGLDITGITIAPTGSVEIEPSWFDIIAKWVEDKGGDVLKQYLQDGAVTIGGDVVIAGSIIVGGIAEIAGACYTIAMGWEIGDLGQSYKPNINAAKDGFKTAMQGGAQPADKFGQAGYAAGQKNFAAIMEATKKANPGASDDAIKAAIAAKAGDALKQAGDAIESGVRRGMWAGYLAQHTSVLTYNDARNAFIACFGYDQKFDKGGFDADWQAYVQQHPKMAALGM
jgi:hypothetical protein